MQPLRFDRTIPFFLLFLLALFLWGGEYARRDLWAPDEARFALVAREMREGGHWLVPFRQGEFYAHKPPLMFWLINAGVAAGLPEHVATRMPSLLGALLALFSITRLAALWHGPRTSWWVALLLPSSYLFWNKGGFGQIDMLLCGLEMAGLYFLFTGHRAWRQLAAYLCFGFAVLAKGPVGLLIPMAVYVAAQWAAGDTKHLRGWHWVWGPLVALAVPGLWLLAAWWQGAPAGYFDELLFKQNVGRVAGAFNHRQPWYYFLYYFPLDFLPWTLLLPLSIHALSRRDEDLRELRRLLAWIAIVILLFSLSVSKRNLYILLVYPAAALLVAAGIERWTSVSRAWLARSRGAALILMGVLAGGLCVAAAIPKADLSWWYAAPSVIAFVAGIVLSSRQPAASPRWLAAAAAGTLVAFSFIGTLVYHEFDDEKTPDEIIGIVQEVLPPGHHLICYKMQGEIISLYAKRPGRMADNEEELRRLLAAQPRNFIITDASRLDEVRAIVGDHPFGRFAHGSKSRVWFSVGPAGGLQPLLLEPAEQRDGTGDEHGEHDPRG